MLKWLFTIFILFFTIQLGLAHPISEDITFNKDYNSPKLESLTIPIKSVIDEIDTILDLPDKGNKVEIAPVLMAPNDPHLKMGGGYSSKLGLIGINIIDLGITQPRITTAHEIFHYIQDKYAYDPKNYQELLKTIHSTKDYKYLEKNVSGDEKKYILNDDETTARAFSQYTANKSNNLGFMIELKTGQSNYHSGLWSDKDFGAIQLGLDNFFIKEKWNKHE